MGDKLEAYKEICENIRESDRISFELLKLVPVVTTLVAGLLTFLQNLRPAGFDPAVLPLVVIAFSVGGFSIVYGIYRWELRNIQKCNSLIRSAAQLEDGTFGTQYGVWRQEKSSWGKTRSEILIYRSVLAIWSVPFVLAAIELFRALCS